MFVSKRRTINVPKGVVVLNKSLGATIASNADEIGAAWLNRQCVVMMKVRPLKS